MISKLSFTPKFFLLCICAFLAFIIGDYCFKVRTHQVYSESGVTANLNRYALNEKGRPSDCEGFIQSAMNAQSLSKRQIINHSYCKALAVSALSETTETCAVFNLLAFDAYYDWSTETALGDFCQIRF